MDLGGLGGLLAIGLAAAAFFAYLTWQPESPSSTSSALFLAVVLTLLSAAGLFVASLIGIGLQGENTEPVWDTNAWQRVAQFFIALIGFAAVPAAAILLFGGVRRRASVTMLCAGAAWVLWFAFLQFAR